LRLRPLKMVLLDSLVPSEPLLPTYVDSSSMYLGHCYYLILYFHFYQAGETEEAPKLALRRRIWSTVVLMLVDETVIANVQRGPV